ncbi:DNA recombination protein RmuC [uncultured Barnesiella sp.]|uniref:DNA recombination protein RmuC n=1 Tax=uncultured Barnesiella sp. TaxID=584861 RepID=UPI001F8911F9|nr:DNA recombination protein RmuC [uncultured Barnesiella sp.]HJB71728.1 DNA recombination protein RmuC [Candidatus Barnesiella merdigallinarum]
MMAVLIGILATLVVAAAAFWFLYNSRRKGWQETLSERAREAEELRVRNGVLEAQVNSCTARLAEMQTQLDVASREREQLNREKGDLQARNQVLVENMEVQKQEVQRVRQEMSNEFKVLANEILQEKSKSFSELNRERLAEVLNPLKERLEGFKKTVEETYSSEARERFSLKEQIKELVQRSETIGVEAKQLTQALRGDSKIQGDWGEMILESILEKSGLEKDREYFIQETLRDDEGHTIQSAEGRKMRPDVIIRYPGGDNRQMVIDSKVSLTAYVNYVNAETPEEAAAALKQHLASVKKHIDELSNKSYQDYVGKGDHVMMFVPNEAAYLAAMQADHSLWQYAYDRRVLLLSPTNLIAALKLVADLWQRDKQTRHAIDIAEEAGKLYDKFVGFIDDMEKIGKALGTANTTYGEAMKKLKNGTGNLIGRVEKLKGMGVKAKKNLPATTGDDESAD